MCSGFALVLLTLVGSLSSAYYRITQQFHLKSKSQNLQLDFQIYRRNIQGSFLVVTYEHTIYSFMVEPSKRSICLEMQRSGVVSNFKFFLKWEHTYKFEVMSSALNIDYTPLTLSSGACRELAAISMNGFPEFGEVSVTESEYYEQGHLTPNLRLSGSGCLSGTLIECSQCLSGFYQLAKQCKQCPAGCKKCTDTGCLECWTGSPQSGACLKTKALVLNYNNQLALPYTLSRQNWGLQFFIQYESVTGQQISSNPILKFKAGPETLDLKADYRGVGPEINQITSILELTKTSPQTTHRMVSIGKWLFYSISGNTDSIKFKIDGPQLEIQDSFSQDITSILFKPESSLINIYLRQLRIFQNSNIPGSLFSQCLQVDALINRLADKRPTGLSGYFKLQIDHLNSNEIQEILEPRVVQITSSGQDTGTLILKNQPNTPKNFKLCEDCFHNCKTCSDLLVCSECESGQLWGDGVCLTSSINLLQGYTDLTRFSVWPIHQQVQQLNSMLKSRNSAYYFELELPWSSKVNNLETSIDMNSNYQFQLPTPASAEKNQFTAEIKAKIKANDYFTATFQISLEKPSIHNFPEVVKSVEEPTNPDNACGCSRFGKCNQNSQCECLSGYTGKKCSYTVQDQNSLSKILARIFSQVWFYSLPQEELLTSIEKLTYSPELLTNPQRINLLLALQGVQITPTNRQRILNLLSNLADTYGLTSIIDQLVFLIAQSCFENLTESLTLTSEKIMIIVSPIDRSKPFKSSYVYISANSLPSQSAYLVQALFKYKKFKALQSQQPASLTLGLSVYQSDGTKVQVKNLSKGISINLPLDSSTLNVRQTLSKIYSEPSEVNERIELNQKQTPFLCRFWDIQKTNLSDIGCTFVSVTYEEITCYCNHMTDFMSFLETGRDVLVQGNHNVFYVLWEINGDDLKRNIGMYFVFCYWLIYISLAVLFSLVDHCKLKNQFYKNLFTQIHGRDPLYEHESERKLPTRSETDRSRTRPSQIMNNIRVSISKVKPLRGNQNEPYGPMKTITLSDINTDAESKNVWGKISKKLKEYASAAKQERKCCCCMLGKVACSELKTNNLPFNLFTTTSSMSPRLIRLTMFCFACMVEFAVCAFFFEIQSQDEDDPPFFWQGLIQNFWIALYTVLFTLVPLVLVGCLMQFPRSVQKKFELASSVEELQISYRRERWKLKCSLYLGMIIFVIFSCLFSVYIICFCHIASANSSRDWLSSSLFSIIIDQLIFQIIPAFIVAFLVLAQLLCKCCKSALCLAIIIEVYRLYRNLTDP